MFVGKIYAYDFMDCLCRYFIVNAPEENNNKF